MCLPRKSTSPALMMTAAGARLRVGGVELSGQPLARLASAAILQYRGKLELAAWQPAEAKKKFPKTAGK